MILKFFDPHFSTDSFQERQGSEPRSEIFCSDAGCSDVRARPECRNRFGVLLVSANRPSCFAFVGRMPTNAVLQGGSRVLAHQTYCEGGHEAQLRVAIICFLGAQTLAPLAFG